MNNKFTNYFTYKQREVTILSSIVPLLVYGMYLKGILANDNKISKMDYC